MREQSENVSPLLHASGKGESESNAGCDEGARGGNAGECDRTTRVRGTPVARFWEEKIRTKCRECWAMGMLPGECVGV